MIHGGMKRATSAESTRTATSESRASSTDIDTLICLPVWSLSIQPRFQTIDRGVPWMTLVRALSDRDQPDWTP